MKMLMMKVSICRISFELSLISSVFESSKARLDRKKSRNRKVKNMAMITA